MSFKRYPSMTESGVEWLGQVPSHWAVQPLKGWGKSVRSETSGLTKTGTNPAADTATWALSTFSGFNRI